MFNRITVQLPVEGLLFWKLSGREAMSESFALSLTLLGTDARIDRSKLLGQPVTISLPTQNLLSPRYLNGKITRVAVSATELSGTRYAVYNLTVEPDLWPMKRDRNLRIFQGQTAPQIVKTLLGEYLVNVEDKLSGSYRVWDYCVQYQESSLDFISRLMELEGITYHFQHDADKHTLVLTDTATQHQPFSGYEVIPYHQTPSGGSTNEEGIGQWALEDIVTPGIYSLDDYDFRKPNAWLFQAQQNPASPSPGSIDVYEWPGRFVEHGHGESYARIRQERWQVEHQQIQGTATAMGIAPGSTFTLSHAPFFSDNGEYLTTAAVYEFEENRYASGDGGESLLRTDFTVIPSSVVYRPAQVTAWPRTYGPQTAKVVGPQGESIWTDKYGRIKVKFHWDRHAKGDDTSSCWVRVSSAWAGQGFGGVQVPRVGDEVVIDFINGDPDRPIVTGRVYNEASMPPRALPAAATQMGFMTRSKGGHSDNSSHLFFEDKPGAELIEMHSEKDMKISVENDKTVVIDGNRSTTIGKEQKHDVTGNAEFNYHAERKTTVEQLETKIYNNSKKTTITNGHELNIVSGGDRQTIKGIKYTFIEGEENFTLNGPQTYRIIGHQTYKVNGNSTHHIAGTLKETFEEGVETTISAGGMNVTINGGGWTQTINGGDTLITSPKKITIHSDTAVDIDAPKSTTTVGGHRESIVGNSLNITAASESLVGASFGYNLLSVFAKHSSFAHTVINVSHNTFTSKQKGMDLSQIGVVISHGSLSLKSKALTMLL